MQLPLTSGTIKRIQEIIPMAWTDSNVPLNARNPHVVPRMEQKALVSGSVMRIMDNSEQRISSWEPNVTIDSATV